MSRFKGTPENKALAQKMRDDGFTWYAIGMWLGTKGDYVRCWFDREFRAAYNAKTRARQHPRLYDRRVKHTPEREAKARRLLAEGHTWRNVARLVGVERHTIRRWVDPDYRARHNASMAENARRRSQTTPSPAE